MPVMEPPAGVAAAPAKAAKLCPAAPPASLLRRLLDYLRNAYSLDLRSLALFRIGLALVLLGDLFVRSFDLTAFYTDWGVLPRAALLEKFSPADRFSVHLLSGQPTFQVALFLTAGVFALMLLFGVRTRFAAVASWFMVVSLQNRNPEILQGGDVYLRLLAFWAIFLPISAVYSVDSALVPAEKAARTAAPPSRHFSVPGVALMLQIAFVYTFSVLLKTGSAWRGEASAVYYALSIQQMSTPVGHFLLHFPKLLPWLTRLTLLHEGSIPVLILFPLFFGPVRTLGVLLIFALHFALGITIRLGHFPWIAAMAALPLLPSWFWERWAGRRDWSRAGERLRLYYDGECPFCRKCVYILRAFLLIPAAELIPAQDSAQTREEMRTRNSWIVVAPSGRRHYEWDALVCLLSHSPLFSCMDKLAAWGPISGIGHNCYRLIRARRPQLTHFTAWIDFRPTRLRSPWYVNLFVAFTIFYVFLWNLSSVTHAGFKPSAEKFGLTFGLDQRWDMFSPFPLTYDGWYVIEGHLRDGSTVNVLDPDKPVSFAQPASIADQYKNERWRKYLMNLSLSESSGYRLYYGRYFCRSWNTGRPPQDRWALVNFDIYFMGHENSISHPPTGFSRDLLWHHECFK